MSDRWCCFSAQWECCSRVGERPDSPALRSTDRISALPLPPSRRPVMSRCVCDVQLSMSPPSALTRSKGRSTRRPRIGHNRQRRVTCRAMRGAARLGSCQNQPSSACQSRRQARSAPFRGPSQASLSQGLQDLGRPLIRRGERIDNPDGSECSPVRQVPHQEDSALAGLGGSHDQRVPARKSVTLLHGP